MLTKTMKVMVAVAMLAGALVIVPTLVEAGRVGGAMNVAGNALPDDYDVITARFQGGKVAKVIVQNISNFADLDVKIIDPRTLKVIAQDTSTKSDAQVQFTPGQTREFIILIHNFSKTQTANYRVRTN